ncbi:MAG TPA: hypothetical protein VGA66_09625, partial [Mycobacterium sp.]
AEEIVAQYGGARGLRCTAVGEFMYFVVPGDDERRGGVAAFMCKQQCKNDVPGEPGRYALGAGESGSWSFYQAPNVGRLKTMSFFPPETLILSDRIKGQICFNLRTGEYLSELPCIDEPTVPPGFPGTGAQ